MEFGKKRPLVGFDIAAECINSGDKTYRLSSITKVTSDSTPQVAECVNALYASLVEAGRDKAASILVAGVAKVIENTQHDHKFALANELEVIFNRINIDTEAAGTKWNFLSFRASKIAKAASVEPLALMTQEPQGSANYGPSTVSQASGLCLVCALRLWPTIQAPLSDR